MKKRKNDKNNHMSTFESNTWTPCNVKLPKRDEVENNVNKFYLVQDEYGDMHVAHYSRRGWESIEDWKHTIDDEKEIVAWMPLPQRYVDKHQIDKALSTAWGTWIHKSGTYPHTYICKRCGCKVSQYGNPWSWRTYFRECPMCGIDMIL